MYKKLVVGFAFMVPDVSHNEAYISFIYTHPEWRTGGIASVMLYHLTQVRIAPMQELNKLYELHELHELHDCAIF